MPSFVNHFVYLQHRTWARVYVSPFVGPDSRSGPVNYLLREGENEVTVELLRTTTQQGTDHVPDAFVFQLYVATNLGAAEGVPLERKLLCDLRYPNLLDGKQAQHARLPLFHREVIRVDEPLPTPPFFGAPVAEFACEGTVEQRRAVVGLFDALERGDDARFLDELSLRFASDERAFQGEPRLLASARRKAFQDELLAFRPRLVRPLELSELHFDSRAGGRVLWVRRFDGQPALDAICSLDSRRRLSTDLLMIQHEGRWRVFA